MNLQTLSLDAAGVVRARFPALLSRNFRLYWAGQAISLIGTWMQVVAVSWLVWRLTHSPFLLGLVSAIGMFPILVLTLFAGVVADRVARRRLILITQIASMVQAVVLAALVTWGNPSVELVLVLVGVMGVINAFDLPARQSFLSETVTPDVSPNAIALHSTIFNAARLLGPAIAGALLAALGEAPCFWINAVTYLAVIWGLMKMDVPDKPQRAGAGSAMVELREGVRYAWRNPRLRNLLILLGTAGSLGFQYTVLLPVYADKLLSSGAGGYGLLMSAGGVGSLLAALTLSARKPDRWTLRRNVLIGLLTFGIALVAFSQSRIVAVSIALNLIAGYGMILYAASTNTLVQLTVEDPFRGRVLSLYTLMFVGTAPFGSYVLGSVAHRFGAPAATIVSGAVCVIGATWVFLRLRQLAREEAVAPA